MTKSWKFKCVLMAVAVVCAIAFWPTITKASFLNRLAADHSFPSEQFTTAVAAANATGGSPIYTRTVFVPRSNNVLYITISATADTHLGAGQAFACTVGGVPCINDPSSVGAGGAPNGWLVLNKHYNYDTTYSGGKSGGDGGGGQGDMHDNSVYYTWCADVRPNTTQTVQLRQGVWNLQDTANTLNATVFIEGGQYFIDADFQPGGCGRF